MRMDGNNTHHHTRNLRHLHLRYAHILSRDAKYVVRIGSLTLVSGLLMLGGLLSTAYISIFQQYVFRDTEGVVILNGNQNYSVFLADSDTKDEAVDGQCSAAVSIDGGNGNEFKENCLERDDRVYLGYIQPTSTGEFIISSNHEIVIEKYPMTETPEFAIMMLSEAICGLGLVGLIMGMNIDRRRSESIQ